MEKTTLGVRVDDFIHWLCSQVRKGKICFLTRLYTSLNILSLVFTHKSYSLLQLSSDRIGGMLIALHIS